jgi:hypothetical protein
VPSRPAGAPAVRELDGLEIALASLVSLEVPERKQELSTARKLEVRDESGPNVLVDRPAAPDPRVAIDDLGK